MIFHKVFLFSLVFLWHNVKTQNYSDPSERKVVDLIINQADQTVKTQMLNRRAEIEPDNSKTYLWYGSQSLIETRGGFDGRLIHGRYSSFYLNNQLKEKGHLRYGLKNSEWKYWYPDGKLREVITWKKGLKNGRYELYNDYGQLMASGKFKQDKLDGIFYTYDLGGKILEKKKYRYGEEIIMGRKKIKKTETVKNKAANPVAPVIEKPESDTLSVKPVEPKGRIRKKQKPVKKAGKSEGVPAKTSTTT